ncbi:MAG: hypothetical protein ACOCV1_03490 [Bacillota bacterium]
MDYASYVISDDEYLAFVLGAIIKNGGMYSKEFTEEKYKGDVLNQHIIKRSVRILEIMGLIKITKKIGRTKVYGGTKLGNIVFKKYVSMKKESV